MIKGFCFSVETFDSQFHGPSAEGKSLNLFYLPVVKSVTVATMRQAWEALDKLRYPNKARGRYFDDPAKVYYQTETSIREILEQSVKIDNNNNMLIIWDTDQIKQGIDYIKDFLELHKMSLFAIRSLNPDLLLQANHPEQRAILSLVSNQHYRPLSHPAGLKPRFGWQALPDDLIESLRALKKQGRTLKAIAQQHSLSIYAVHKYTKDIPTPIRHKSPLQIDRRVNPTFDTVRHIDEQWNLPQCLLKTAGREFIESKRSYHTKKRYFFNLKSFFDWISSKNTLLLEPKDITFFQCSGYLAYLKSTKNKSVQVNYFTVLKLFLSFCVKRGYLQSSPAATIQSDTLPRHKVSTAEMTEDELKRILDKAHGEIGKAKTERLSTLAHRNFILLYILAATGARIGSILAVKKSDLKERPNRKGLSLILRSTKGGQPQAIPLNPMIADTIERYTTLTMTNDPSDSYLFFANIEDKNFPLSKNGFHAVLNKILAKCEITKPLTAHSFRAFFATSCHQAGMAIKDIQESLGHKNINQTAAYIKAEPIEYVPRWISNFPPVGRPK